MARAEEHAWLAQRNGDWPEAHARWTAVRSRYPDSFISHAADGVALRWLGRFDEAEAAYRTVFLRWPGKSEFDVLGDYAELAQARGDALEASRRWAVLRKRYPDNPRAYFRDAVNFTSAGRHEEADTLLREAQRRFSDNPTAFIELAHSAHRRGLLPEALRRWEAVLKAFPGHPDGYVGAARILFALGRLTGAQTVLRPAVQLFPDSLPVAELYARLAFALDDFKEAANRWSDVRQRFPESPAGFSAGVDSYLEAADHPAAAELSELGRALFPGDIDVAVAWSTVPEVTGAWEEAEMRWASTCAQFPSLTQLKSRYVRVLLHNQKWMEAETVVAAALAVTAGDLDLMSCSAECATERGDWDTATLRWRQVAEAFPASPIGASGYGDMLRRAGHLTDAADVIALALAQFPGDVDLEQRLAWIFNYQRDWPEALNQWLNLTRKYPQRPSVIGGILYALREARQDLEFATSDGSPPPFEIPADLLAPQERASKESADLKRLLMQFESLGDTCEFGMVQGQFGAEPMGLLRFTTTGPSELVAALDDGLAGVGEPEHTVVEVQGGEYVTWDRRYRMYANTFTPATAEPLDRFAQRQLRRIRFLRRKLLEDLAAGEKIFLYKRTLGLSEPEARAIHAAIRRYNSDATLLCVMLSDAAHPTGSVVAVDHGLFIGHIDRFSTVDINIDAWVEICRQARQLRDSSRASPVTSAAYVNSPTGSV